MKAKDGATYDQTWNIGKRTGITTVRDMVAQNLQQAGWSASTSGNAVIITGHKTDSGVSGPTEVKAAAAPEFEEKAQPAISTTDGVEKVGQVVDSSTPWVVSFVPLDDTNPTMTEDATFSLTVDDTTVTVDLTSGMTVSQAGQALYNAMVSAGFPDVSLTSDGSGVTFVSNASGSIAINVNESWSDDSTGFTSSGGGFSAMIDIADATVEQDQSSISLSSSVNPAAPNQEVTFTAAVSGNSVTPTGTVTFMADNTILGTSPLDSNGNATFMTSTLSLGQHNITAVYNGDDNYPSSAGFMTQTIGLAATNVSLSSSENPAQPGDPLTFTIAVTAVDPSVGTPTGTVTLYNGTTFLGTFTLDANGNATFNTSLGAGEYDITAIYSGDDVFSGGSDWVDQTVGQPSTTATEMELDSSGSPSLPGQAVTFTAGVTGLGEGGPTPTGSVTFYDGTTVLGTSPLDANGIAVYTTSALSLGDHNITAIYSGDGNYSGSTASMTQSVALSDTTTSLTADVNPSPLGQMVTFTITVAPADMGPGTPTGTVDIYDGTTLLGTATLSPVNGQMQATFATDALGLGSHTILAIYSGDSTYADSGASLQETID